MCKVSLKRQARLDYKKQLGFDLEPVSVIENHTRGRVKFDCYDYPQDDEFTELLYMQCENRETDSLAVFNFLSSCLNDKSNLLVEIFACDNHLLLEKVLYSNETNNLYYGYGWQSL